MISFELAKDPCYLSIIIYLFLIKDVYECRFPIYTMVSIKQLHWVVYNCFYFITAQLI